MRRFRVSAVPREGFRGFWRAGRFFPNAPDYVELDESEMNDAIRDERMLIVTEITSTRKQEKRKDVSADSD